MARRRAAVDMAGLCEYEASDAWTKIIIRKLREPTLPGYARDSLEQCYRADQEFWLRVSDECRTGVAYGRDGVLPVSAAIKLVMRDPSIILMMCPLPTQTSTGSSTISSAKSPPPDVSERMKRKVEEKDRKIEALQIRVKKGSGKYSDDNKGGGKEGKGKGKKKGDGSAANIPFILGRTCVTTLI